MRPLIHLTTIHQREADFGVGQVKNSLWQATIVPSQYSRELRQLHPHAQQSQHLFKLSRMQHAVESTARKVVKLIDRCLVGLLEP